jgi:hypothetical protein
MVDRIPSVARRARRLRRLATKVRNQLPDAAPFLAYEDLRVEQQVEREMVYFNAGFEHGRLVGRASLRLLGVIPAVRQLAYKLRAVLATATTPPATTAAVMTGYAHALLVPDASPRNTSPEPVGRPKGVRR